MEYSFDWGHKDDKQQFYDGTKILKPKLKEGDTIYTENLPRKHAKGWLATGVKIMRVHANKIAEFRESNGHEKSDELDAMMIWEYHQQNPGDFRHWEGDSRLKILYATFKEIQKMRVATGNRTWSNEDETNEEIMKDLLKIERKVNREINKELNNYKVSKWLLGIRGINSATAGGLMAYIDDISKFDNISSLWSYFGLGVTNGAAPKLKRGTAGGFNTKARSLVLGVIGDNFIKQRTPQYRELYDTTKDREAHRTDSNKPKSKMHAHRRAVRKMMKIFVSHLWLKWREAEGLAVTQPYVINNLKHTHMIKPA